MKVATEKLFAGSILSDQITLESEAVRNGVLRYHRLAHKAIERGDGAALKPAERMLLHWYRPLRLAIIQERREIRGNQPGVDRVVYGPAALAIDAARMSVITIREALSWCLIDRDGAVLTKLAYVIGNSIMAEANLDVLRRDQRHELYKMDRCYRAITPRIINRWAKKTLEDCIWNRRITIKLGVCMIWLLIGTASSAHYDKPFKLAFHHYRVRRKSKTIAMLAMGDDVYDLIDEGHGIRQYMRPRYEPMLVAPYPWQTTAQGGYVRVRTPFVSKPSPLQKKVIKEAIEDGTIQPVYDCLNALNGQSWRINRRILALVQQVWESGGGILRVPLAQEIPLPPRPHDIAANDKAKRKWKDEAIEVYDRNRQLKGERGEFLNRRDVAQRMVEKEKIYFPHQLDFRGRVYPIPPHLNHQGDDLCRGLLEFAEKRPVDERGAFWLAVHAANCYGFDKTPFHQRWRWAGEHASQIGASAQDPLNTDWWQQAEKPWQFLAACIALTDPNAGPHLPIQLDGTCNGLQHYAAMGLDRDGAAVVNMVPSDEPNDVYSDVARRVAPIVAADANDGSTEAMLLDGMIDRALVKQTVMTSVYGVTAAGATQQIYTKLEESGIDEEKQRYKCAYYLSAVTRKAMKQVCHGAWEIMAWLRKCATIITSPPIKKTIQWVTPLGLPILQPYRKYRTIQIKTILQEVTMIHVDDSVPIKPGKQRNGFAPNFVHSIDATHMFMTARACRQAGIDFASVHDSYWTHASAVDQLNVILRQQFVDLHRDSLTMQLHKQLSERYPQAKLPLPPPTGDLDLESVMDSAYFFS